MKSRKHLILLTGALLLGSLVATAKPGPKGNPCQGFFEAPFLAFFNGQQVPGSEGKLCYWEGDPTLLHAKVEVGPVESNRTWCVYLVDGPSVEDLFSNGTSFGALLHTDDDGDNEVFFDEDICVNGCGDENLEGPWLQPGFWVFRSPVHGACRATPGNGTRFFVTGVRLPGESF
jgi:hypothetical protein